MRKSDVQRYARMSRWIHWLMAVVLTGMIVSGILFDYVEPQTKPQLLMWHARFGLLSFLFILMRIAIFFFQKHPPFPHTMKAFEKWAASVTHFALYLLMLGMPLSGYFILQAQGRSFDVLQLPLSSLQLMEKNREWGRFFRESHEYIAWLLIALSGLHVAAVLYHHFMRKEKTLHRML